MPGDLTGERGAQPARGARLYARVWRWHFFAGLFVAPLGILLAASGSVYLFKPQIEAFVERGIHAGAVRGADLPADDWVQAALAASGSGATLQKLVLPRDADDPSVEVQVRSGSGSGSEVIWLERSTARVLARRDPEAEPVQIAKRLHGELMTGEPGSRIVELAACWMIVLIVTGIYLAWPRRKTWRQVLLPALHLRTRLGWRDLHAAAGLWMSGAVLLFLVSGLPWTGVWGKGFDRVADALGMSGPGQEFRVTLQSGGPASPPAPGSGPDGLHAWHSDAGGDVTLESTPAPGVRPVSVESVVERARALQLIPPVEISPPRGTNGVWTVRAMSQRRPDRMTVHYDRWTGEEILRIGFEDRPALQRAVSYGISLHEGQLFGPLNQALGVGVALSVVWLCTSGLVMWWRRRPTGSLAAPPLPTERRLTLGVTALILTLGALLPLVGASLIAVATLEHLWSRLTPRPA